MIRTQKFIPTSEWGVKEAVHIKANKPSLNKEGGRYKLSGVYEAVIRSKVKKIDAWYSQWHHSLASENSEVGIHFVFGSKEKLNHLFQFRFFFTNSWRCHAPMVTMVLHFASCNLFVFPLCTLCAVNLL